MVKAMARQRHIRLSEELDSALIKMATIAGVNESLVIRAALEQYLGDGAAADDLVREQVLAQKTLYLVEAIGVIANKIGAKLDDCESISIEKSNKLFKRMS